MNSVKQIVDILKGYEERLSDGYKYYYIRKFFDEDHDISPDFENNWEDSPYYYESPDDLLEEIAKKILNVIKTLDKR